MPAYDSGPTRVQYAGFLAAAFFLAGLAVIVLLAALPLSVSVVVVVVFTTVSVVGTTAGLVVVSTPGTVVVSAVVCWLSLLHAAAPISANAASASLVVFNPITLVVGVLPPLNGKRRTRSSGPGGESSRQPPISARNAHQNAASRRNRTTMLRGPEYSLISMATVICAPWSFPE